MQTLEPTRHWRAWGELYNFSFKTNIVTRLVVLKYRHGLGFEIFF